MSSGRWIIVVSAIATALALGAGLGHLSKGLDIQLGGLLSGLNNHANASELSPEDTLAFAETSPHEDALASAAGAQGLRAKPQITSLASVLNHTARERNLQDNRRRAIERQEAREAGMSVGRILEIAAHPMFLLFLALPLFFRRGRGEEL